MFRAETKNFVSLYKMNGKNILVTGGAGYIGSHTVVQLIEKGFNPIILDDFSNSYPWIIQNMESLVGQKISFFNGSCQDSGCLQKLKEAFPEIFGVIHFAAFKAVGESVDNPLKYYQNNIQSLNSILAFSLEQKIENFVFSSSCTVYGEPESIPVSEEFPVQEATSPYGYTKQVGEQVLRDVVRAYPWFKVGILRYFNPIGAHKSGKIGELPIGTPNNLVPFIAQVASGKREKLSIFGSDYPTADGTCIRDYIHVMDLADAHIAMLDYLGNNEEETPVILNVGTGEGKSVLELVKAFMEENKIDLNYTFAERRKGDVIQIYADNTLVKSKLKWQPQYSIREALNHVWKWEKYLTDK